MKHHILPTTLGLILLCLFSFRSEAYELQISAPPIATSEDTVEKIERLTSLLSDVAGIKTRFVSQKTWLSYTKNVRLDIYDMLISEAHITAWALRTGQAGGGLEHAVIARTNTRSERVLVTFDGKMRSVNDVIGKRICVRPSPSLDSVLLYKAFTNPVVQPTIVEFDHTYDTLINKVIEGNCDAAVIDQSYVDKNNRLRVLKRFPSVYGPSFSISKRLPPDVKNSLHNALENENTQSILAEVFHLIAESKTQSRAVPALASDYQGYDQLLDQVWGW